MDIHQAIDKVTPILNQKWTNGVCSFGWVGDDTHRAIHQQICHRNLSYRTDKEQFFYNTITTTASQTFDQVYDFCEWLLSDQGPWRNLMKDRSRAILVEDNRVLGYVLETFPDDDPQLLRNLAIAGRLPQEFGTNFAAMNKMIAEGVCREDAFYLSHLVQVSPVENAFSRHSICSSNHTIMDHNELINLKRFIEGTPTKASGKLLDNNVTIYTSLGRGTNAKFTTGVTGPVEVVTDGNMFTPLQTRWARVNGVVTIRKFLDKWFDESRVSLLNACKG